MRSWQLQVGEVELSEKYPTRGRPLRMINNNNNNKEEEKEKEEEEKNGDDDYDDECKK